MPIKLQDLIAQQKPGQSLLMDPPNQEFEGPVVLHQPLVLQGQGATIRARKGPLLTVESKGVQLRHLNLEITGERSRLNDFEACALMVKQGISLTTKDVLIRGNVCGVVGEEGRWIYPRSVRLGKLLPQRVHRFTLRLALPCPCELLCAIDGMTVSPQKYPGGDAVEVTLELESLKPGIRIRGDLAIKTPLFSRQITITASAAAATDTSHVVAGDGQLIYDCRDAKAGESCNGIETKRAPEKETAANLASDVIVPKPESPFTPPTERHPSSSTGPAAAESEAMVRPAEPPPVAVGAAESVQRETQPGSASRRRPAARSLPLADLWAGGASTPLKAPSSAPHPALTLAPQESPVPPGGQPVSGASPEDTLDAAPHAAEEAEEQSRQKRRSPRVRSMPLTNAWSPTTRDEHADPPLETPATRDEPAPTDADQTHRGKVSNSLDPSAAADHTESTSDVGRQESPRKPSVRTRMSMPVSAVFGATPIPAVSQEAVSPAPSASAVSPPEHLASESLDAPVSESVAQAAPERPKKPKIIKSVNMGVFGKGMQDN